MTSVELKNLLTNLANNFHFENSKKNKLIVFLGLLGDFDSFEYAINLKKFALSKNLENLISVPTKDGKYIYMTQKYNSYSQAKTKLIEINQLGYEDAYIVKF
mgnify:CR=1 FL=1